MFGFEWSWSFHFLITHQFARCVYHAPNESSANFSLWAIDGNVAFCKFVATAAVCNETLVYSVADLNRRACVRRRRESRSRPGRLSLRRSRFKSALRGRITWILKRPSLRLQESRSALFHCKHLLTGTAKPKRLCGSSWKKFAQPESKRFVWWFVREIRRLIQRPLPGLEESWILWSKPHH